MCCYRYKQRIGSIDIEDLNLVETENPNSTDSEVDCRKFADSVRSVGLESDKLEESFGTYYMHQ